MFLERLFVDNCLQALRTHHSVKGLDEHLDNAQCHLDTVCAIDQLLANVHAGSPVRGGNLASVRQWIEYLRMINVPTSLKALEAYEKQTFETIVEELVAKFYQRGG